MAEESQRTVQAGDTLAGKYLVERVLGEGGMGMVVAARHVDLQEVRAIKLMRADLTANPEAVERFLREARAAVRLKSEHIAKVHDVGRLDNGAPYLVMEYLEGNDLQQLLRSHGPLPIADAVAYFLEACEGIAEAHAAGIVHRDLKPANLFVSRGADGLPCIKVLDFGISKLASMDGAPALDMTKTTAIMGSPLYMSPEQMQSTRDVDARTDIWALGIILCELTTGVVPFQGESITQLCAMVLQQQPTPPSRTRPGLPIEFDRVVLRCLDKSPAQRYANVAELAMDLLPFTTDRSRPSVERICRIFGARGQSSSPPYATASFPPGSSPQTSSPPLAQSRPTGTGGSWGNTGSQPTPRSNSGLGVALGVVFGVLLIGIGAAAFLKYRPRDLPPDSARSSPASAESASPSPSAVAPSAAPSQAAPSPAKPSAPSPSVDAGTSIDVSPASDETAAPKAPGAAAIAKPVRGPAAGAAPRPGPRPAAPAADPFGDQRK